MIVDNYEYEQEMRFLPANLNPDGLLDQWAQFPPYGPRAYEPPSPFLIQQVRVSWLSMFESAYFVSE